MGLELVNYSMIQWDEQQVVVEDKTRDGKRFEVEWQLPRL